MDTQTRNELSKASYVAASIAPGPVQMLMGLITLIEILLGWFSITLEVFIRFNFGTRYLSLLRLLLAWWTFNTYKTLYFFITALSGIGNPAMWLWQGPDFRSLFAGDVHSFLYQMFLYGFMGLSLLHLLVIWKRDAEGVAWFSMSFGSSFLSFLPWELWEWLISFIPSRLARKALHVDDWKLYCWIEPLLCYIAGQSAWQVDGFIGSWIVIASIALFIKNNMVYYEMRGRALDIQDSEIEGKYLQAARSGAHKSNTAGFAVVPVAMQTLPTAMDISATVRETLNQQPEA